MVAVLGACLVILFVLVVGRDVAKLKRRVSELERKLGGGLDIAFEVVVVSP